MSVLSGEETQVKVARKTVDATYYGTSVPSTHTPKFEIAGGVQVVPPNGLSRLWQTAAEAAAASSRELCPGLESDEPKAPGSAGSTENKGCHCFKDLAEPNKKVMLWKLKKQNFSSKSDDEKKLINISLNSLNTGYLISGYSFLSEDIL